MDLESKRREYETLENDLRSTKSSYKTIKFAFIEKLSKETCLNSFINDTPITDLTNTLGTNKSALKDVSARCTQLRAEITAKCQDLVVHQDTLAHNLSVLQKEREENRRLRQELDELQTQEAALGEVEDENETVMHNLGLMEDKINEIEKVSGVSEDEICELTNEINAKAMTLKNYKEEVEENTGNIKRQERYLLYKKGMEFVESITGTRVLDCAVVENGFRVLVETSRATVWLVVVNNVLSDVRMVDDRIGRNVLKEVIEYSIRENDPVYLLSCLMNE